MSDEELKKIIGGAYCFVSPDGAGEHLKLIALELLALRPSLAAEREKSAALAVTIEIKNLAICRADHVLRDEGYSDESEERLNLYRAATIPANAEEVLRERDEQGKANSYREAADDIWAAIIGTPTEIKIVRKCRNALVSFAEKIEAEAARGKEAAAKGSGKEA